MSKAECFLQFPYCRLQEHYGRDHLPDTLIAGSDQLQNSELASPNCTEVVGPVGFACQNIT